MNSPSGRLGWFGTGCVVVLAGLIILVCHEYVLRHATVAAPVRFFFPDLPFEASQVQIWLIDFEQKRGHLEQSKDSSAWFIDRVWIDELILKLPEQGLDRIERLLLTIGDADHCISGTELRSWNRRSTEILRGRGVLQPDEVALLVPRAFGRSSALPWISPSIRNWPGDWQFFRAVGQTALLPVLLLALGAYWLGVKRSASATWVGHVLGISRGADIPVCPVEGSKECLPHDRTWNWAGFLFLIATLTFLEVREPYYFTQSDNLIECLPQILTGCRSLWEGVFPDYNPYLYLGSPLASLGLYALTYPPTQLSYAVARHVLGQEYATLEVFAFFHLFGGFFAGRFLARRWGMGAMAANLVALSFVLSGASLIMGRAWFSFVPIMLWLPLLLLGLEHWRHGPVDWAWLCGMGVATGLPFHVGFPQVSVYLAGSFGLGLLYFFVADRLPWTRLVSGLAALLLGAGIAMPLVYQQWLAARGVVRQPPGDTGVLAGLPAMLLPYPLVQARLAAGWGNAQIDYLGHLYFFGGLLALVFLFQVVGLLFFRADKQDWPRHFWTVAALTTVWLALGDSGGLWNLLSREPLRMINRHPLRLLPFLVFFVSFSGGLVLERLLQLACKRARLEAVLGCLGALLLAIHACNCQTTLFLLNFQPYPELSPKLRELLWQDGHPTGRMNTWSPPNSADIDYAQLLALNIGAVHRVPAFHGINALWDGKPIIQRVRRDLEIDPQGILRKYGVRWNMVYAAPEGPRLSSPYSEMWKGQVTSWQFHWPLKFFPELSAALPRDADAVISELKGVDPLAFVSGERNPLPLYLHGQGIDVDIAKVGKNRKVIVNFFHYPEMRAYVDGIPVPCLPDTWNRMQVELPAVGEHTSLSLRFRPPWASGLYLGLAAMIAAGVVFWFLGVPHASTKVSPANKPV